MDADGGVAMLPFNKADRAGPYDESSDSVQSPGQVSVTL